MKYRIFYASNPEELEEEVQRFMDAGWELHGPLAMAYGLDSTTKEPRVLFAREMVRPSIPKGEQK